MDEAVQKCRSQARCVSLCSLFVPISRGRLSGALNGAARQEITTDTEIAALRIPTTGLRQRAPSATVRGCLPTASLHPVASAPGAASSSSRSCRWCQRRRWSGPGFRADLSISLPISARQLLRWLDMAAAGAAFRSSAASGFMPAYWSTSSASPPVGFRRSKISRSRRSGRCAAVWPSLSFGVGLLRRMARGPHPSGAQSFVISNLPLR
jgi:hypothetical protein